MGTTADKLNLLLNSKADIKAALVEKGQTVSDVFSEYGDKIRAIQTGVELPALTNPASASEIGEGYEAINAAGERVVGTGELAVSLAPELTEQDSLIAQIFAALEGKMVPSGGGTVSITVNATVGGGVVFFDANGVLQSVSASTIVIDALGGIVLVVSNDAVAPTVSGLYAKYEVNSYNYLYCFNADGENAINFSSVVACCFVEGTQVLTSLNGTIKSIEDFVVGDAVVSYNVETGENYIAEVKRLIIKTDTIDIAEVTFDNGTVITMNAYHPIYTENGWHSLTNYNDYAALTVGDNAKVFNGWSKVVDIKRYTSGPIVTYNLDVIDVGENPDEESNDTFYANGIVVHNGFC